MGSEATAFLLRQADTLVKEKKYEAAMKLVRAVRAQDPQNPYAIAYEERIRAIILNVSDRKARPTRQAHTMGAAESAMTQNEEEHFAVAEDSEAGRRVRIRNYIRLARTFFAAGREEEALNELAFASMIDPNSDEVKSFEAEIRHARAEHNPDGQTTELPETRTLEAQNTPVLEETGKDETLEELIPTPEPERIEEELITVSPAVEESGQEETDQELPLPVVAEELPAPNPLSAEPSGDEVVESIICPEQIYEETVTPLPVVEETGEQTTVEVSATSDPAVDPEPQIQVPTEQVDTETVRVLTTPEPAEEPELRIQDLAEQVDTETVHVLTTPEPAEEPELGVQDLMEQVDSETVQELTTPQAAEEADTQIQAPMEQAEIVPDGATVEPDATDHEVNELIVEDTETTAASVEHSPEPTEAPKSDSRFEENDRPKVDLVKRQMDRATKMYMSGDFDEALAEVALGLVDEPDNAELRGLERKIWQAKDASSGEQVDNRYQRNHLVRLHLLAAEEFRKKDEFTRALDEVAKAYALDPGNKDIKQMDARIREGESRQNTNDGKILKLVYPNARTAGGSA